MKYPIKIDTYKHLLILRDDLLIGGTKSIFIPHILEKGIKEYVYASPVEGGFQLALSKNLGKHATIFVAKRNTMHDNQKEILENGSKVIEVPFGYLSNVESKARHYSEEGNKTRKLIEWGGSTYVDLITNRAKQVFWTGGSNLVCSGVGNLNARDYGGGSAYHSSLWRSSRCEILGQNVSESAHYRVSAAIQIREQVGVTIPVECEL
jgi:hypothetical protein